MIKLKQLIWYMVKFDSISVIPGNLSIIVYHLHLPFRYINTYNTHMDVVHPP